MLTKLPGRPGATALSVVIFPLQRFDLWCLERPTLFRQQGRPELFNLSGGPDNQVSIWDCASSCAQKSWRAGVLEPNFPALWNRRARISLERRKRFGVSPVRLKNPDREKGSRARISLLGWVMGPVTSIG